MIEGGHGGVGGPSVRRFPALYRMPVAYLALAVVAGLWVVARGAPRRGDEVSLSPTFPPLPVDHLVAAPAPKTTPQPVPDAAPQSTERLGRKVMVRELDLVPRKAPDADAKGRPLDYYGVRFVHGESPTMLQVGPRSGVPDGWVPRESVVEWDTRLMARPSPLGARPALVMYREEPCAAAAASGRPCPNHARGCPIEGDEAPAEGPGPPLGWPVLQSRSIPGADGKSRSIYEVAAPVSDRAPPAPRPEWLKSMQPALRQIYVAFVIDTTTSMAPNFDAVRVSVKALIDRLAKDHPDASLHLALVEYRDDAPGYGFRARLTTKFTEPLGFRAFLAALGPPVFGDQSVDEAVLDGVELAVPGTPGGVDWPAGRAGELATKLVVLIGDAPDHSRDLARAGALAARAKAGGIAIAAVKIDRPGTLTGDEQARFDALWRTLSEGSYHPPDRTRGSTSPRPVRVEQVAELPPRVEALREDRIEQSRALAARAAAEAEARLKEYVDGRGRTISQVAPVLVDLHRGEAAPTPRPDPRFNGRKAPSIRRGWVAERVGNADQVDVEILMTRDELDSLIAELAALQQALAGSAADPSELIAIGRATGEASFFATDRGSGTFADHLRLRFGVPVYAKGLLDRTQSDLLRADSLDRAALDGKLRAALLGLTRRRNAPDWSDPRRTIEDAGPVPYDGIDF
jgi:hypothetical protein